MKRLHKDRIRHSDASISVHYVTIEIASVETGFCTNSYTLVGEIDPFS